MKSGKPFLLLSTRELKFKLLEHSRKRSTYAEGFELYTKKVDEFLSITVQPKLKDKTLNLAMSEMMKKQLIEFGYEEKKENRTQQSAKRH